MSNYLIKETNRMLNAILSRPGMNRALVADLLGNSLDRDDLGDEDDSDYRSSSNAENGQPRPRTTASREVEDHTPTEPPRVRMGMSQVHAMATQGGTPCLSPMAADHKSRPSRDLGTKRTRTRPRAMVSAERLVI